MSSGTIPSRTGKHLGWLYVNRGRIGSGLLRATSMAGRNLLRNLWTALRQIGLQIFGITFLFFAVGFGYQGVRQWRHFQAHGGSNNLAIALFGLALLFVYFGISSFARASNLRE